MFVVKKKCLIKTSWFVVSFSSIYQSRFPFLVFEFKYVKFFTDFFLRIGFAGYNLYKKKIAKSMYYFKMYLLEGAFFLTRTSYIPDKITNKKPVGNTYFFFRQTCFLYSNIVCVLCVFVVLLIWLLYCQHLLI